VESHKIQAIQLSGILLATSGTDSMESCRHWVRGSHREQAEGVPTKVGHTEQARASLDGSPQVSLVPNVKEPSNMMDVDVDT
jgi:hypothetical protein